MTGKSRTPEQQAALERHIEELAASAPKMTEEQAARLRRIMTCRRCGWNTIYHGHAPSCPKSEPAT